MRLSKSRYLSGCQCPLKLWYDCYDRALATPPDAVQQAVFDTGTAVGELARKRYPGGRLVEYDHFHSREALAQTVDLLGDPAVPSIYEAAFLYRDVLVRVDILVRTPTGWNLVEVKSGTRFKEGVHDIDVAIQLWVLRGAGLAVDNAGLLTLNREYVYDGRSLDLDQLFVLHDCTDIAESLQPEVGLNVDAFMAMLNAGAAPAVQPGEQCFRPYDCAYYAHCTRDLVLPEHPVAELPRLGGRNLAQLLADGIAEIPQVPDDFSLTPLQARVREAVVTRTEYVSDKLGRTLQAIRYPVYHLDFETFMPAIPRYAGTSPYAAIPFQYSLHVEYADGRVEHIEYLHEDDSDPRSSLTVSLIDAVGTEGAVCVYSGYEKQVISALAGVLPQYARQLRDILDRLWDLLPVVREHYYHPGFHGSFSIKKVLPVLVPELGYDGLAIQDGQAAGLAYLNSLAQADPADREKTFRDLKAYCGMDTEAMLQLRRALLRKA
jgi:hypothetical protein